MQNDNSNLCKVGRKSFAIVWHSIWLRPQIPVDVARRFKLKRLVDVFWRKAEKVAPQCTPNSILHFPFLKWCAVLSPVA